MAGILSKALVGSTKIDPALDALFGAGPATATVVASAPAPKTVATSTGSKRKKNEGEEGGKKKIKKTAMKEIKEEVVPIKLVETSKQSRKRKSTEPVAAGSAAGNSVNDAPRPETSKPSKKVKTSINADKDTVKLSAEDAVDNGKTVESGSARPSQEKRKSRRETEREETEKNERTIFVGNLPTNVIEKAHTKELKALFAQHGKLDSIRFRSIARATNLPRKAAFITKSLHPSRDTLNAYVVFTEKESVEKALAENGKVFMGKHIRVDRVVGGVGGKDKKLDKQNFRKSVFLGGLPFDVSDETVWTTFSECGEIDYVRVIRDKATNIGKGIGYVQFKDRASVALAITLNDSEISGRKIRVSACKDTGKLSKQSATVKQEGARAQRPGTGKKTAVKKRSPTASKVKGNTGKGKSKGTKKKTKGGTRK
ncbi:Nucleolar protein 12 [Gaertneriomyces sp. JEL0708]|nr:Nucleolar protein 12 [Gaertneriomyces sp. JEL0708]